MGFSAVHGTRWCVAHSTGGNGLAWWQDGNITFHWFQGPIRFFGIWPGCGSNQSSEVAMDSLMNESSKAAC